MKRKPTSKKTIGVTVSLILLTGLTIGLLGVLGNMAGLWSGAPRATSPTAQPISGDYDGSVTLQGVYVGTYNDIISPTLVDLGNIDLSLHLDQSGTVINGYVSLSQTLVYSHVETIMVTPVGPTPGPQTPTPVSQPLDIGPRVHGAYTTAVLHLESDPVTAALNELKITRRFSLVSTKVENNGASLSGVYRETIWGYNTEPSTVVGAFTLQRPVFEASRWLYLPVLFRQ